MTIQDMAAALAARDAGIENSSQHAEDVMPGWGDEAARIVTKVVGNISHGSFTMEMARNIATAVFGLPHPPELRAWGAVTVRLIREGIIEKTGLYAPAASSHGAAKPLYRRKGIK